MGFRGSHTEMVAIATRDHERGIIKPETIADTYISVISLGASLCLRVTEQERERVCVCAIVCVCAGKRHGYE